jgi:hypothetical protein
LAVPLALGACNRNKERPIVELAPARISTIGVNSWLWRASLETIAFMPIAQVDSAGGVIVTDWYSTPQATNERVKLTIAILDQELRADAIRVSAVRQVQSAGGWVAAPVRAGTVQKLEELILTRARDLRRGTLPPED